MPPTTRPTGGPLGKPDYERLSHFRHRLRHFLRASEPPVQAARPDAAAVLPAAAPRDGLPGRAWATAGEPGGVELQAHHHGVVALLDRCEARGLLERRPGRRRPAHGRDPPAREGRGSSSPASPHCTRTVAAAACCASSARRMRRSPECAPRPAGHRRGRERIGTMTERPQTLGEEIANSVSHGAGLVGALAGAPLLIGAGVAGRHGQRRRRERVRGDDGPAAPRLDALRCWSLVSQHQVNLSNT
ncbi:MAG: hypothetical protein MZV65_18745 [Chromatiales bacterium]|nr:hypothetical protein [Chromatiales bacterium]